MPEESQFPRSIVPVEPPLQFEQRQIVFEFDSEVDSVVRTTEARKSFSVDGSGLTVAVLDTGMRTTHVDFAGRIVAQRNFTKDNGNDPDNASDGNGHGTNVGGIIAASGIHTGMAPGARIIPIKVLTNKGGGDFQAIADALQWVLDHREEHNITAVCMSLGDGGNYTSDENFGSDAIRKRIRQLRDHKVLVGIAAGNDYFTHDSEQGMGYPAIFRESVTVGAVYDAFEGDFDYGSGAVCFSSGPDRITPFSQRLHENTNADCRTDIFAPGAPVTSAGIANDEGESVQQGTSQATPVVVGVALLMQELHQRLKGELPAVDDLVTWMRRGAVIINDGDDENDNVEHTNEDFPRLDAVKALEAVRRALQKELLVTGQPLK